MRDFTEIIFFLHLTLCFIYDKILCKNDKGKRKDSEQNI